MEGHEMTEEEAMRSEFVQSVQQMADILTGKMAPSRSYRAPPAVDVRAIRKRLGLSQTAFANRFGFSVAAVREWEQGRRRPEQAARTLLLVIARNPQVVMEALDAAAA